MQLLKSDESQGTYETYHVELPQYIDVAAEQPVEQGPTRKRPNKQITETPRLQNEEPKTVPQSIHFRRCCTIYCTKQIMSGDF